MNFTLERDERGPLLYIGRIPKRFLKIPSRNATRGVQENYKENGVLFIQFQFLIENMLTVMYTGFYTFIP